MGHFSTWSAQMDQTQSEADKRALISEIGLWRTKHLTDVPAQRDAAWAMAQLYDGLGNAPQALAESRTLVSLCQTHPEAPESALKLARRELSRFGGGRPSDRRAKSGGRTERTPRDPKVSRDPKSSRLDEAIAFAHAGDLNRAMQAARGLRGANSELFRVWVDLKRALNAPLSELNHQLQTLEKGLSGRFTVRAVPEQVTKPAKAAVDPLDRLGESEAPFSAILREARAAGWTVDRLRHGVSRRAKASERLAWTARLLLNDEARELVYLPARTEEASLHARQMFTAHANGGAEGTLIYAEVSGNERLISELTLLGFSVTTTSEGLLEALMGQSKQETSVFHTFGRLLAAEERPSEADLSALVGLMHRVRYGLKAAQTALQGHSDAESRALMVLNLINSSVPATIHLGEGTVFAAQMVVAFPEGPLASALKSGPLAERFAGLGFFDAVTLSKTLSDAGITSSRLSHGLMGKERRDDPVLAAFDVVLDGFWRLFVEHNGAKVQVYFVAKASPEERAALARLVSHPAPRVVVLPLDPELLEWAREAGVSDAIGWTGDEGESVVQAVNALLTQST